MFVKLKRATSLPVSVITARNFMHTHAAVVDQVRRYAHIIVTWMHSSVCVYVCMHVNPHTYTKHKTPEITELHPNHASSVKSKLHNRHPNHASPVKPELHNRHANQASSVTHELQ
jgi:hypothetical protein